SEHIMSQWQTVCMFPVQSKSSAHAELAIGSYKQIRIVRLMDLSSQLFVDIRLFRDNHPTRIGLCLHPTEYNWVMSQLERNKRGGKKVTGQRELQILKPVNWAFSLKLCRPSKDPIDLWFSSSELKSMVSLASV